MPDVDRLTALVEPVVEEAGAELVDLEVAGSAGRPVVRVYADTEEGITLDACARLSRRLEAVLESTGAVPERYVIEVSSPGIDRPLTKRAHFERYAGEQVRVGLYRKRDGSKKFIGTLVGVRDRDGEGWTIEVEGPQGERWTFDDDEIARARLHVTW